MTAFLTAVSSRSLKPENIATPATSGVDSPESALETLKAQPDLKSVGVALKYLATETERDGGFSILTPDPVSGKIAHQLINTTLPDYWRSLDEDATQRKYLVRCLRNPCGIGNIISRLRPLIADCKQKKPVGDTRDSSSHIEDLLDVLEDILRSAETSNYIWRDIQKHAKSSIQKKMVWKEYLSQAGSGRVLGIAADAEDALKERGVERKASWLANGSEYAEWLGFNVAQLMRDSDKSDEHTTAVVDICAKALGLGYTDSIVSALLQSVINSDSRIFAGFLANMKGSDQRKYMDATIAFLIKNYFASSVGGREDTPFKASKTVSGAAALIHGLLQGNKLLKDHLVTTLSKSTLPALADSLSAHRSIIVAISQDEEKLQNLLENSLKLFGDSMYINHAPALQQEALAKTIVMSCAYVQRSQPMFLTMMAKSSYHVSGMSNRIGATSPRARHLGIIVGSIISRMTDKPELQLKFELEGEEATEAEWYQRLAETHDEIGSVEDLKANLAEGSWETRSNPQPKNVTSSPIDKSPKPHKSSAKPETKGPRIIELLDESEDDDQDLMAYEKPDSDPEDDNEDPTEVNRNKPTAPVYIRDLIAGLRDQEDYDRHQLALSTAPSLIRRKANFGTEVSDHIEELATILVGLNDNLEIPNFAQHRQQALLSILLAKPAAMAQWFALSFFTGDYSLQQRTVMLTTLGVGARELAGIKDSSTEELLPPDPSFPSKQLPPSLHAIYSEEKEHDPVRRIAGGLVKELLSPMAANAADQLNGPNALKVRTFSSRMEVEKKKKKAIPNALAQIVADNFFFPLTGRWWMQTRSNNDSIYASTHLLPAFLHTLALLLNASGPNTLSLPQMTRELWDLLLSVRGPAHTDKSILGALLFAFLMLLETNENKERLATEQGKELLETQQWTQMVFEGLASGSAEDERIRVLAAGVVVRCGEVVEKYQRRLAGSMMDY